MTQLLVVVLREPSLMPSLLEAWQIAGVPGVTIMRSAGVSHAKSWLQFLGGHGSDAKPEMADLTQRTLFAVVDDEAVLTRAVGEASRIIGDFDEPGKGLLMILPVEHALGVIGSKKGLPPSRETRRDAPQAYSPAWKVRRDTPVEAVARRLDLKPTIVRVDASIDEVSRAMLAQPSVHVACVVEQNDYLVGLIDLPTIADQVFFHILPEEFLSELSDLQHAIDFAGFGRQRTARDAMKAPVWIMPDQPVKEAFRRMHDHQIPGLPIVDAAHHVVGYVNLLELLAFCTEMPPESNGGAELS